jgi:uncharacterized protein YbaR (Trm112 family)
VTVVQIPSAPQQCPECRSEKLGGLSNVVENGGNSMLCHDCGIWIQIGQPDPFELTASIFICPHCKTIGSLEEMAGAEWCNGCGLDPSIESYSAPALSHLWKKKSDIQRLMQQDTPMLAPDRQLGKFVRTYCGPHCAFAEDCPQETGNLVRCYKEEYPSGQIGGDMSKKSKKARKQRRKERREEREAVSRAGRKALVQCAGAGWFEKVLYANSPYPEQTGDTGSGSGT